MRCPHCNKKVSDEDSFCKFCGRKIKHSNFHINWKYLFFIILGIGVLIIIIFAVSKNINYQKDTGTESKKSILDQIIPSPKCGNQKCEGGEDSSNCCLDCGCNDGYYCDGTQCKKQSVCGNGIKEDGETSENCCTDAGCSLGQSCQNNVCIILKPEISYLSFSQTTESYSVTFLKAKGNGVGKLTLINNGNDDAKNVKVTFSSPDNYFASNTISFGNIDQRKFSSQVIDLIFLDSILSVTTDEDISIEANIEYYNSVGQKYTSKESFTLHIAGRNYMTWQYPQMVASWVTSTQPIIKEFASKSTAGLAAGMENSDTTEQLMAAQWLFESMRAYGVRYVNDAHSSADYIQFPIETLKNKAGDCDDNAILYSSLLESIGMKSFLVLVPSHIFSGYISSDGYAIPIETTASDFKSALTLGIQEYKNYKDSMQLIYPSTSWSNYPEVNLPETEQLKMPSITKQVGKCETAFSLDLGVYVKMPVKFTNTGDATGAGCAAVNVYDNNGQKIDDDVKCWTILPQESKQYDYIVDISIGDALSGYYCSGY